MRQKLSLQSEFGDRSELKFVTDDIFAIWWEEKFDHDSDTEIIFKHLKAVRQDCLHNLCMENMFDRLQSLN